MNTVLPPPVKIGRILVPFRAAHPEEMVDKNVYGYTHTQYHYIVIDLSLQPLRLVEVVIHELIHAFFAIYKINPKWGEERTVTALGKAFARLFQRNPKFLPWLVATMTLTHATEEID